MDDSSGRYGGDMTVKNSTCERQTPPLLLQRHSVLALTPGPSPNNWVRGDRSGPVVGSPSPSFWERGLGGEGLSAGHPPHTRPEERAPHPPVWRMRVRRHRGIFKVKEERGDDTRRVAGHVDKHFFGTGGVVGQGAPSIVRGGDGSRLTGPGVIRAGDGLDATPSAGVGPGGQLPGEV